MCHFKHFGSQKRMQVKWEIERMGVALNIINMKYYFAFTIVCTDALALCKAHLLLIQNGNQESGKRGRTFCSIFNVQILQNEENGYNLSS